MSSTELDKMFGDDGDDDDDDDGDADKGPLSSSSSHTSSHTSSLLTNTLFPCFEIRSNLNNIGGGRGCFATNDMTAGTLIVAEVPTMAWSNDISSNLQDPDILYNIIIQIINDKKSYEVALLLHPQNLNDVDNDDITRASSMLSPSLLNNIYNNDNININKDEIIRMILVLQHNGFSSGLYHILTKFNHSCQPNCIKFQPTPSSFGASEIWSIRDIIKGEELTINYCELLEMTRVSMQAYLYDHHRFKCLCSRCSDGTINDTIVESMQASNSVSMIIDEENIQKQLETIETELLWLKVEDPKQVIATCHSMLKTTSALLSLIDEADTLNTVKVVACSLKARILKCSVNCATLLLKNVDILANDPNGGKKPKKALIQSCMITYAKNSILLASEQHQYLGNTHPDLAATYVDIVEGLSALLDLYPDQILITFPSDLYSWSVSKQAVRKKCEEYQREANRLKGLYSFNKRYPIARQALKGGPGCHYSPFI